ncbi:nitroreductase family protein [Acinetobacter zhairhuonensis]|uniref:nitroreductase family protein n=1 Tax=Acinetobacter sp. A7.4 TaxID=2919921 RepID=UPI001F4F2663|nr:nitroreductase family protein [Acinetobacter sp. A7.4]MCJ8161747.1 nitroreductase family protein [Acinetobacter sp. A7.4]
MALLDKLSQVLTTEITPDLIFNRKNEVALNEVSYLEQLKQRQSIQKLGKRTSHDPSYLTELIHAAVLSCPSALSLQSTRIVVLFAQAHTDFWNLVYEILEKQIPEQFFPVTAMKIKQSLGAYGTVLFFEDQEQIKNLQKNVPLDSAEMPFWSQQSSGMAQYAVWAALAEVDLGANFNYYNPVIDYKTAQFLKVSTEWKLQTQLVFGSVEQHIEKRSANKNQVEFMVLK